MVKWPCQPESNATETHWSRNIAEHKRTQGMIAELKEQLKRMDARTVLIGKIVKTATTALKECADEIDDYHDLSRRLSDPNAWGRKNSDVTPTWNNPARQALAKIQTIIGAGE